MTAEAINTYATQAGIDPSRILIVNAKYDAPDWSWGYGNGAPSDPCPWTHVFLTEDTTALNDPKVKEMLSHAGPIDGWLNNHTYNITINGAVKEVDKSLVRVYQRFLAGELS